MHKLYLVLAVACALVMGTIPSAAQHGDHQNNGRHLGWNKHHPPRDHDDGDNDEDNDDDLNGKDTTGNFTDTIIIIIHHHGGGSNDTTHKSDTVIKHDTINKHDTITIHDTVRLGGGLTGNAHHNPYGLSDTCLALFISRLSSDTATIVKNDLAMIDSNRIKRDTLVAEWNRLKAAKDTTKKADSIKALIKLNDQASLALWMQLIQIGVADIDILAQVHIDCNSDPSINIPKGGGNTAGAFIGVSNATPNPVNAAGPVSLSISSSADAPMTIQLFDEMGYKVLDIMNGAVMADSNNSITFNTTNLKPGVYILRVQSGVNVQSQKIVVN